ncbi:MAG TPA: heme ABC exporter ATP-binding protein CcmA [Longimicrobiales bacterium]
MTRETGPGSARNGTRDGGTTAAVAASGIARRFGHRWALRGVSLRVEPGEVAGLVGHNGSGKTTLLRVLATTLRPTRGGGEVFGFDLVRDAGRIRELVAVLGHAPGLYGDLTARENLEFALRMCGRTPDKREVDEALDTVGLAAEADELVRTFSAGMQRRLALGRVLLRRPRLILLDEPYAAFDADGIARVNEILTQHKAAGNAAIVATHDPDRAAPVVDRFWAIARGRILESAPPGLPGAGEDPAGTGGVAGRIQADEADAAAPAMPAAVAERAVR